MSKAIPRQPHRAQRLSCSPHPRVSALGPWSGCPTVGSEALRLWVVPSSGWQFPEGPRDGASHKLPDFFAETQWGLGGGAWQICSQHHQENPEHRAESSPTPPSSPKPETNQTPQKYRTHKLNWDIQVHSPLPPEGPVSVDSMFTSLYMASFQQTQRPLPA